MSGEGEEQNKEGCKVFKVTHIQSVQQETSFYPNMQNEKKQAQDILPMKTVAAVYTHT